MSLSSHTKVQCPDCGHEQDIEIYQTINVSLDPELKEKLFNGNLTSFNCQKCKYETQFPCYLLYNDIDKMFLIQWIKKEEDVDSVMRANEEHSDNILYKMYKKRIVFSLAELIEKISIFDAELNDKTVEYLKLNLKDKHFQDTGNHIELIFDEYNKKIMDNPIVRFLVCNESFEYLEQVFEIPFSLYKGYHDEIMQNNPKILEDSGDWMHVDEKMVIQKYKEDLAEV